MKFFNTAGPVNQDDHYKIDPLLRWDLEEIEILIEQKKYFILHAPRQTGKTSSLLALQEKINAEDKYICIYANFEVGQASRNNISEAIGAIVFEIISRYCSLSKENKKLEEELLKKYRSTKSTVSDLNSILTYLSEKSKKPVIFLIDEIDSLVGDTLISVLRQIRAGYDKRPALFPQTIILCGLRDIKDYRIQTTNEDIITGGSAFNIKAESLKIGNFTKDEIIVLYNEHTKETGQKFEEDCFDLIWNYTAGQPWLVNALAYEATFKMKENRDRKITITKDMMEIAKNRLVISRATHLDQLADKLEEDRVRRVILPMLKNSDSNSNKDDEQYCIDLGLVKKMSDGIVISNDIYMEIIPRELTDTRQNDFLMRFKPDWVNKDESLNTETLISMFVQFWRENSEIWASHIAGYQEAAPHLVFQAYLQRVANGKGFISREYGLGRKRTDLMLKWRSPRVRADSISAPQSKGLSAPQNEQRVVIELKVMTKKDKYETIKEKALLQTAEYAKKLDATESHILIFDRDEKTDWRDKVFTDKGENSGIKMKIWGM